MPRKLIGLTGNIATGKSEVARMLHEFGAVVVDADRIVREVVRLGRPALDEIARVFGRQVLLPDGELNRKLLGTIVFNDQAKLRQLEAITHPAVRAEMWQRINTAPNDAIVVIEVIKLVESSWADRCDQVWVTNCSPAQQIARLMQSRGMTEAEARSRVEAQNPQADKLARADVVIDTSGSLEDTQRQVERAWRRLATGDS